MDDDDMFNNLKGIGRCLRFYEAKAHPECGGVVNMKDCAAVVYLRGYLRRYMPIEEQPEDIAKMCRDIDGRMRQLMFPQGGHASEIGQVCEAYLQRREGEGKPLCPEEEDVLGEWEAYKTSS